MARISLKIRDKIYRRDGGCLVCGITVDLTIDHIIPLSRGGRNYEGNLQTLCSVHNGNKADTIIDYRENAKGCQGDRLATAADTCIIYNDKKYKIHGYLNKELAYVNIKFKIGTPVYYNKYEELLVVYAYKTKKIAYPYESLKGYLWNKEQFLTAKPIPKPKKDYKRKNIQAIPDIIIPNSEKAKEYLSESEFWERYNSLPEPNFHYE